ncbi:MAG: biosynthetic-type acetolactate synthase large subunit [Verrucomicrobiota bacterium]|jgi:acetolactate synthase-1/2/3 large subunit|nr:biosynthetic-type acetolactate synthase large subunit [Verrucomicrobiota bacterium]
MSEMKLNGADALILSLEKAGIRVMFGLPGGPAIPLFDALYRLRKHMRFVLARHEQGATHMADGYARATGQPAAVMVTSGPGATNTVTGIMTAYMDSVPLVVITGQSARNMLGKDAFQETDVFNLTMPIVKHSYLVRRADDIPRIVKEAVHIATSGRPGPVLIDIPKDVAVEACTADLDAEMYLPGYHPEAKAYSADTLRRMAEALAGSRRPVILAGHGAVLAHAEEEVKELAETVRSPVTATLLGKGVFPESHPLSLGMPGMHGTAYANRALVGCDLVISVGARMDDRILGDPRQFCRNAVKIHIDVDGAEFGKFVRADISCQGDAKAVLRDLLPLVKKGDTSAWLQEMDRNKKKWPMTYPKQGGLRPPRIIDVLNRLTGGRAVMTTDVGQHQMWAAQFFHCDKPWHFITSGGGGTMGFGLPSAIGAQIGRPGETVVAVVGDGGFQMTMAELATVGVQKLPIKIILMNNHYLGMVRQWQDMFYDARYSGVDLEGNPDFVELAGAYGIYAQNLRRPADIEKVLKKALAHPGPALINAEVIKHEEVYPMVPAGRPLEDMILEHPRRRPGRPAKKAPLAAACRREGEKAT